VSRLQLSSRRNVIAMAYLAALVVTFLVGAFADTYAKWTGFGILSAILLFGAIPVGLLLLFVPQNRAPMEAVGRKPIAAILLLALAFPAVILVILFGALVGSSR
jgi:hypothetical protein